MRGRDITPSNHDMVYDYFSEPERTWPTFTRAVFGLSRAALNPVTYMDGEVSTEIWHQHLQGKTAIIASNHPSSYDPFVASAAIQATGHPAFEQPIGMAKLPLFTNPATRFLFEHTGCIPVMRRRDVKDSGAGDDVISDATYDLLETLATMSGDQGRPIAITPEGTRSGGEGADTLTPERIKDGIAKLALLTSGRSYIVPMGIFYGHPAPERMKPTDARNAAVVIGRPITEYAEDPEEIRLQVHEAMSEALEQAKILKGHQKPIAWTRRPRSQENI